MDEMNYRAEKKSLREGSSGARTSGTRSERTVVGGTHRSSQETRLVVAPPSASAPPIILGLAVPNRDHATTVTPSSSLPSRRSEGVDLVPLVKKRKCLAPSSTSSKKKHYWEFEFNSDHLITEDAKATASLARHFRRPGLKLPTIENYSDEGRENYLLFSRSVGELLAEHNRSVDAYERRLRSAPPLRDLAIAKETISKLSAQLEKMQAMEEKNAEAVKQANERMSRLKRLEAKCRDAEVTRDDCKEKLKVAYDQIVGLETKISEVEAKYAALVQTREFDVMKATRAAQEKMAAELKEILDHVKLHLAGRDAVRKPLIRAAQTKANFDLLDELVKGDIMDPQAELAIVAQDKEHAEKALVEAEERVSALDLSLLEFPPFCRELGLSDLHVPDLDEFGTNLGGILDELRIEDVPLDT